jgi:hypothetical protein
MIPERKMALYQNADVSRMRAFTFFVAAIALALLVAPATAADVTIPVNKDYRYGDMVVHILRAEITDQYKGNTYSADPDNSIWPKLWFTYENKGTTAVNGNLYVAFMDDKGNIYQDNRNKKTLFDSTMNPIAPGSTSDVRFVETAAPRGTNIVKVILYDYEGREDQVIDISTSRNTATTSPSSTGGQSTTGTGPCAIFFTLPIAAAGIFVVSRIRR